MLLLKYSQLTITILFQSILKTHGEGLNKKKTNIFFYR